jgi:hypothetical protein
MCCRRPLGKLIALWMSEASFALEITLRARSSFAKLKSFWCHSIDLLGFNPLGLAFWLTLFSAVG